MLTKVKEPVYFLLVDDLEENILSLDALIRREGLITLKANSGPEALELLLTHDVALALLDVQMPGMDGFELAELMRGTERTRRVPIIFLTAGAADWQRRFRGYEAGAVDFLHKPIEPDILRSKVNVFFDLERQRLLLLRQHEELHRKSAENERLLEESRQYTAVLKDADRRKDEFLATLAHELRNPLAPIRNGLHILRMASPSTNVTEIRDMMDRQLTHLVRLIDDLMDVSRVSQGKIDLRYAQVTVQDVVKTAVETSQPQIDTGGHILTVRLPEEKLWLNADLTRLAQVVSNLLNNAAKYTPYGGTILLTVERQEQQVKISVADNGIGIPAPMLGKVFDLFTQVESDMARSQGGLGIGLALARRLVDMHKGTISATSPGDGKGSIFTIHMPLLKAEHAEAEEQDVPEAEREHSPGTGRNIPVLIVDDNVPAAQTTGWMLELLGYQPTLCHNGLEALEVAKALRPAIIMLDIGLPGMDGYTLCRELRKDPAFKNTRMIAQTGWGREKDRQESLSAGFDHHLTKPVNMDEITKLLAE